MIIHFFIKDGCVNCHQTNIIYEATKEKYKFNQKIAVLLHTIQEDKKTFFWVYDVKICPSVVISYSGMKKNVKYTGIYEIFKAYEENRL